MACAAVTGVVGASSSSSQRQPGGKEMPQEEDGFCVGLTGSGQGRLWGMRLLGLWHPRAPRQALRR